MQGLVHAGANSDGEIRWFRYFVETAVDMKWCCSVVCLMFDAASARGYWGVSAVVNVVQGSEVATASARGQVYMLLSLRFRV